MKNLLLSLPHMKRLSLALMQILELECIDVKIMEERTKITGYGSYCYIYDSNVMLERNNKKIIQRFIRVAFLK